MNQKHSNQLELAGQVALVTGAAQGLGQAIALGLAERGAHVMIGDLKVDVANELARNWSAEGLLAQAVELNIGDSRSVSACFEKIVAEHGRLDMLVNNAGVGQNVAAVVALSDEEWQRVIHVTLTGTFYCCRAAGKIMRKQNSGTIVNIASINGHNPAALVAAYNVAKAGVISLTKTLALELAPYNVRVNAISPGPVYTEFNRSVMSQRGQSLALSEEQMIERVRNAIPLGRWGQPQDIADAVAFLCGPQSGWITGEVLKVSGGLEGVSASPPKDAEP